MASALDISLDRKEFLVRRSNRLTHETGGGPPLPCGFFLEVLEGNKTLLASLEDGRELIVPEVLSSLAGSFEARARAKLADDVAVHLETKTHAGYTHDYYKLGFGGLLLLEWFRQDEKSARAYVDDGFDGLFAHCQALKTVLEKHFPTPEEVYDHIPSGNGIRSVYHQVYRILSKEMFEDGLDLKTAHMSTRLEGGLTIEPSREVRKALNIHRGRANDKVDLYGIYQERTSDLLDTLEEVFPLIEKHADRRD